ncbi:unnamed protein product, partial [Didymodactylos carnosus]
IPVQIDEPFDDEPKAANLPFSKTVMFKRSDGKEIDLLAITATDMTKPTLYVTTMMNSVFIDYDDLQGLD